MKHLSNKDQDRIAENVTEILALLDSGALAQVRQDGSSSRFALNAENRVRKAIHRICKAAGAFPVPAQTEKTDAVPLQGSH